eukprot:CAMPEP_0197261096 /NCGR_PEP_ID=MMETSP1429-20130617/84373_1 /TAXON_ID=49237 /ORGANISM="Chaetoceros  sp., Strain UNC1202" /LENGTH=61 /DNA_ID=CAMNT_0042725353 /DNA_START=218 /DNA_END=403 /DNA_ORIENTATION=+
MKMRFKRLGRRILGMADAAGIHIDIGWSYSSDARLELEGRIIFNNIWMLVVVLQLTTFSRI